MEIPGSEKVKSIFGLWPVFHDAEIVSFLLERNKEPKATLKLNYWQTETEYSDDIHYEYVKKNNFIITFLFSGLSDSNISGFNHQNVIDELRFTKKGHNILVEFDSIFGAGGCLVCKNAEITKIQPYEQKA